jgi:TfoX/Sxy family transcriptional regulator of competence genes
MINWWQIWTIVLACACVCLFVATGLALRLMYRYKAENERLHLKNGGLLKAIADQAERNTLTVEAYVQVQSQLEASQKECHRLSDYSVESLHARVRFEHEAIKLQIKLDEALPTGEIKQSRTRQKPLARTE